MESLPRRLVVVGAGLLGGSLLAALQTYRPHRSRLNGIGLVAVSGERTLDHLRALDWCDDLFTYGNLVEALEGADLVILCSPIHALFEQLGMVAAHRTRLAPGAIVTDVGSTKSRICREARALFPFGDPEDAVFVGGHPMAGSERSGIGAADPMLYQSAIWVLCPPPDLDTSRLSVLHALMRAVGARPLELDPDLHDRAVARASHVPQLLATALAGWSGEDPEVADAAAALAAGGFRDMTRLALSSWNVWKDILTTNRGPVANGLREMADHLRAIADDLPGELENSLSESLENRWSKARLRREGLQLPRKGMLRDLAELVVRVEDRPGQILALLRPLAEADINVQDLEVLKVREGEMGTVLLGFADRQTASDARLLLSESHFLVMDR